MRLPAAPPWPDRDWVRVSGGESGGAVYRCGGDDPLFLKTGVGRVADDIADEAHRLRWLTGRVACPDVRYLVQAEGAAWLVTTALRGRTADDRLEEDADHLPAIVRGCADLMGRLHALPIAECPFRAGADVRLAAADRNAASGLVDTDDFDDDHRGWSAEEMLAHTQALLPDPCTQVVTHGDFSLGNVLFDSAMRVTGLIDVGRLGIADPYQDVAILWQNLGEFGRAAQAMLLRALGIAAVDERRLLFHRCLDELF